MSSEMAPSTTSSASVAISPRRHFSSTAQLLVEGGDARIALDAGKLNRYGFSPFPDPGLGAFGSSTASGISETGFAAADRLRSRLIQAVTREADAVVYVRELERMRQELLSLCEVSDLAGLELVFAASGTDLHLIAAQLAGAGAAQPMLVIIVDATETGSGVAAAVAGRHFSSRAAQGEAVIEGAPINGAATVDSAIRVVTVAIRSADGRPRPPADIDAEFASWVTQASCMGQRVLLVLTDISKTGMIAPSPACVLALQRKLPDTLDVFVDACQFRIAASTLRAYLGHGFMVALTGSKFVTGPPFSGALFIPQSAARRLRQQPLPRALSAYSARADWPESWDMAARLDNVANFGLLLRWEAALDELRAFRAVPEAEVENFLQAFARAVHKRLMTDPAFEPLSVPALDRSPMTGRAGWDHIQTIFPFLLFHPPGLGGKMPLSREQTSRVYRLLQIDLSDRYESGAAYTADATAASRFQLGQPVACGSRDGVPVSALRLCVSARLIVEATLHDGRNAPAVIEKAMAALGKTAWLSACDMADH